MTVFVDTSALFALIAENDPFHAIAAGEFFRQLDTEVELVTSNYVLLETIALVQNRVGMDAIRILEHEIVPALRIEWIEREAHERAFAALTAANRRQLSLVDMTSFVVMHQQDIDTAFTFDEHFSEHGFAVVPG